MRHVGLPKWIANREFLSKSEAQIENDLKSKDLEELINIYKNIENPFNVYENIIK